MHKNLRKRLQTKPYWSNPAFGNAGSPDYFRPLATQTVPNTPMRLLARLFHLEVDYTHRVFGLDVVRAWAILLVVFGHGDRMLGQYWQAHPVLEWLLLNTFLFFFDGVDLFFVLSGFLIGSILLKVYTRSAFEAAQIRHFWMRRWLRTLPNYYLMLCLNVVVWYFVYKQTVGVFTLHAVGDAQLPKYFLFVQNLNQACPPFFVESWSLAIEEWFYLLLPLVIWLVSKSGLSKQNVFLTSLLLFLVFSIGLRFYKVALVGDVALKPFDAGNLYRTSVLTRLDALMLGVLGAYLKWYYGAFWHRLRWWAFGLGVLMLYWLRLNTPLEFDLLQGSALYGYSLHTMLNGLAILLLIPLADSVKQGKGGFWTKALTHISLVSYSMYLTNLLIIRIFTHFIKPQYAPSATLEQIEYLGFWAVTIGVSTLLYKYFEKPIMDLRER